MRANRLSLVLFTLLSIGCTAFYTPTAPDDNWTVRDTPRFSLYARPGSFCDAETRAIEEVLENQYDVAVSTLGLRGEARISMFLYNSGAEVSPPLPSPRSGVAFPHTRAVHLVCVPPFDDNLVSLLAHEANHVIVHQDLGTAGTSFMNEGLASALISEQIRPVGATFLHRWARTNRTMLIPLATLTDDAHWDSNSTAGYRTSASFLAWLLDRYGRDRLRAVYPARSSEMNARIPEVYGRSLAELEAEWVTFLGS